MGNQQFPTHHPIPASNDTSGLRIRITKSAAKNPDRRPYDKAQSTMGTIILVIILLCASIRTCDIVGSDTMRLYRITPQNITTNE